jgi:sialidase-1
MKLFLLSALACVFLCPTCTKEDTNTQIIQKQPEYPVLKSKGYNNILQLQFILTDTMRVTNIRKVLFSTEGTTNTGDIESAALYYTGDKDELINEKSLLFSETSEISSVITLTGSLKLKPGKNFFMLSYSLKDDADILHHAGALCLKAFTDHGKAVVSQPPDHKALRFGVAVRKQNDDNADTYRIPGLVVTNSGTLISVYDIRRDSRRDLQGNIDIGISRSTDGGSTWGPMIIALDMGEWGGLPQKFNGVSDACLLVDRNTGKMFVAGLWMYGVLDDNGRWIENLSDTSTAWNHQWRTRGSQPGFDVKETSQFLISKSADDGLTWSEPVNLTRMCKKEDWWLWAPSPGNGITLADGTLVFPTQGRDKTGEPFSNISYSRDGGITWKTSTPAYTNTTECAVVQLDDGSLMLNMRNNRNRNNEGPDNGRAVAVTENLGETWTMHPTSQNALIEPVCMASLYKHTYFINGKTRSILFFSNPSAKSGRHHITIKASLDNGNTWPEKYRLLLDEGRGNGYSCLTGVDNDHIGILYEGSQADLVFQKIPLTDILKELIYY